MNLNNVPAEKVESIEEILLSIYKNLKKEIISDKKEFTLWNLYAIKLIIETFMDYENIKYQKIPMLINSFK